MLFYVRLSNRQSKLFIRKLRVSANEAVKGSNRTMLVVIFVAANLRICLSFTFFRYSNYMSNSKYVRVRTLTSSVQDVMNRSGMERMERGKIISGFRYVINNRIATATSRQLRPVCISFMLFDDGDFFCDAFDTHFLFIAILNNYQRYSD